MPWRPEVCLHTEGYLTGAARLQALALPARRMAGAGGARHLRRPRCRHVEIPASRDRRRAGRGRRPYGSQ